MGEGGRLPEGTHSTVEARTAEPSLLVRDIHVWPTRKQQVERERTAPGLPFFPLGRQVSVGEATEGCSPTADEGGKRGWGSQQSRSRGFLSYIGLHVFFGIFQVSDDLVCLFLRKANRRVKAELAQQGRCSLGPA